MTKGLADTGVTTLRDLQDQLSGLAGRLDIEALATQSYAADWKIADVLSHLGSQLRYSDQS